MSQEPDDTGIRVYSVDDMEPESTLDDGDGDVIEDRLPVDGPLASLGQGNVRASELVALSDLPAVDLERVRAAWPALAPATRLSVIRKLLDLGEDRLDYRFDRVFRLALMDTDPAVRQVAVSGLWEDDDPEIALDLIRLVREDPSEDVRAAAAAGLARFAELAELGQLDERVAADVREVLFAASQDFDESWHVRRRALEAAAEFASDERLAPLILDVWSEDEIGLRGSAIYAMGRSRDGRWISRVIDEFVSDDAEIRFAAARSAGLLGDVGALPGLSELAQEEDAEVRAAAIASIGEIGGSGALRILRRLLDHAPEVEHEAIDDALIEASIVLDPLSLGEDQ